MQYLRARYYKPETANFLTEDSYLGDILKPLTLNRYNYCAGNPVNYKDPSGNVGAYVGAIVGACKVIFDVLVDDYNVWVNGADFDWKRKPCI